MQVSLREIRAEDAAVIAGLEKACFLHCWSEESVLSTVGRRDFCGVLVETDGEAAGYLLGTVLFEDSEVLRVAVLPERRRLGLGAKLLDCFFEKVKARGGERVFLEVRESNAAAIALYESRAFRRLRVRERYYENGENAVEMKKELL